MRVVPLALSILFASSSIFAAEIREFDLKTVARLGREMNRVSHRADKGATDAVRKQAQQIAIAALRGRLFKIRYDFLVVDDPDGSGFLVYAMPSKPGEVVLGGNFRVTSFSGRQQSRARGCHGSHFVASAKAAQGNGRTKASHGFDVSNREQQTVGNLCLYQLARQSYCVGRDGK